MRLGVAHGRVARHVKPLGLQAGGKALCVFNHGPLVFVLEGVHFIRGHQLAEQRSEVMVGDAAGEGARFDRLPEAPFEVLRLVIHADHAALRAEEGLVRRAGDDLRALFKRLLEVVADQAQHMGHVVHDGRADALLADEAYKLRDRLLIQHHGLAEDHEFRPVLRKQQLCRLRVDAVRVVGADGEIDDHLLFGDGIDGDIVVQRTHGLCGQMAAADDMVVHDPAEPLRRALAVDAVLEVHERGEDGGIGHLAGGHARFDLRRAEELLHLLNEQCLDLADEVCALIIEDLRVIERLLLFMLGIAVRRIGGRKQAHGARLRVFGRNEIDAPMLPPEVVLLRLFQERGSLFGIRRVAVRRSRGRMIGQDGTDIGRGVLPDVPRDDLGRLPLAADVDLKIKVLADARIEIRKADGALARLGGDDRFQSLSLRLEIRNHRAGGHIADGLSLCPCVPAVDREALAQNALACKIDRLNAVREILKGGIIAVHDLLERLELSLQCGAANEIALFLCERDGEFGQRHSIDRDLAAKLALPHFMAVERQRSFHAQRIARAERGGSCPEFDQTVPKIPGVP